MSSDAIFSPCGKYRYRLLRDVHRALTGTNFIGGTCLFAMLNPSTADETADDPTIRRCRGFALGWGYARIEVVNLFALRATNPKTVKPPFADAVGPDNDKHIAEACKDAHIVVCAWGQGFPGGPGRLATASRADRVLQIIRAAGHKPHRIGAATSKGAPPHPLYLSASRMPEEM